MQGKLRYLPFALAAIALLLLAVAFRQPLLQHLVMPLATAAWLALRLTILTIPQQVLWWAVIGIAVLVLLARLPYVVAKAAPDPAPDTNPFVGRIRYWQAALRAGSDTAEDRDDVRAGLADLLVSVCAADQQSGDPEDIRQALRAGKLALPDDVQAYLFPLEAESRGRGPAWWRSSRRHRAAEGKAMEGAVAWIETLLDIRNDDELYDAALQSARVPVLPVGK